MLKIYSVQILRGLAAMLVLIHHFMQQYYNFSDTNAIGNFFSNYGAFGVDIFFTLSGFIMVYTLMFKGSDSISFAKNRLLRVVPNYWFYTFVIVLLGLVNTNIHSSSANVFSIMQSLLFIPNENPDPVLGMYPTLTVGWTLNVEMFFYGIFSLVLLFNMSIVKKCILTLIILISLPLLYKYTGWEFYKSVIGNLKLFEFAAGIAIGIVYVLHPKFIHSFKCKILGAITSFLTAIIVLPTFVTHVVSSAMILYIALVVNDYFSSKNMFTKFGIYLGEISYSIYLSHSVVILCFWSINPNLDTNLEVFFTLILIVTLTIIISNYSYKYIENQFTQYLKSNKTVKIKKNTYEI